MKNINNESLEKEVMEKGLNDPYSQQLGISVNQQSIQSNSNTLEDKSDIPIVNTEEGEVQMTFQRRPQFRFDENNKRRFS